MSRRERESKRERREKETWLPGMAERLRENKGKKEQGSARERTPNQGDIDGRIHWQIYYELRAVKPQAPQIPQQKAWVPPSGRPAAIWPFWR